MKEYGKPRQIGFTQDWLLINEKLAIRKRDVSHIHRDGKRIVIFFNIGNKTDYQIAEYENEQKALEVFIFMMTRWTRKDEQDGLI